MLLLKCLGPAESEWHGRTFEVRSEGCIGGRRRGDDDATLFMAFGDATVSRRHFEISRQGDVFYVSDLKSVGHLSRDYARSMLCEPERSSSWASISCASSVESNPPHLELQCVQPEGSPLQHQVFDVGTAGATLGRKASHVIAFSRDVDGTPVGVDSSVSNEHATITYDVGKGGFVLRDASSTNGTWVRLRDERGRCQRTTNCWSGRSASCAPPRRRSLNGTCEGLPLSCSVSTPWRLAPLHHVGCASCDAVLAWRSCCCWA